MSYEPTMKRLPNFLRYVNKVYGFSQTVSSMQGNSDREVSPQTIFMSVFLCSLLRIEEDGFNIYLETSKPGPVGDIGVIRSDRSSRLLEVFLVGYDITGDEHWLEIYEEKLRENHYARLRDIMTPSRVDASPWESKRSAYGILQSQVSLMPLFELESNLPIRMCYLEAIRVNATVIEDRLFWFRDYDPNLHDDNYNPGGWRVGDPRPKSLRQDFRTIRPPCEAMVTMLLACDKYLIEPLTGVQEKYYTEFWHDIR